MTKNRGAKIFAITALNFFALYVAVYLENDEFKNVLITLSQLNVAIAVGIGALSIGYIEKKEVKGSLTEATVSIAALSLITFLIAHVSGFPIIHRIYLVINVSLISIVLVMTLIFAEKTNK
ncbi:hypothetical protein [Lysinibacillus fusiformis]|uniref:hypothetical protein n=1 Tax=Lysinibacillus fusiformis TaxID=28031 RepID=UPI0038057728